MKLFRMLVMAAVMVVLALVSSGMASADSGQGGGAVESVVPASLVTGRDYQVTGLRYLPENNVGWIKVKCVGTACNPQQWIEVQVIIPANPVANLRVQGLGNGSEFEVGFMVPNDLFYPTMCNITATINPDNVIRERTRSNNTRALC